MPPLWTTEWIVIGFFAYLLALSRLRRLRPAAARRVMVVTAVCVTAVAMLAYLRPSPSLRIVREWVPGIYLMQGYWLCGLFFERPMRTVEQWLLAFDRRLFDRRSVRWIVGHAPRVARSYFELAYLLTYPFVPAGFALFLTLGGRDQTDEFWTAVLVSSFACYGMLPWIQTRPPRAVEPRPAGTAGPPPTPSVRRLNLAVLDRVSVQANTFPSGHASTSIAVALAVATVSPAAGAPLIGVALSIVVATVVGRYHYAADSLLGAAIGLGAWWVAFGA